MKVKTNCNTCRDRIRKECEDAFLKREYKIISEKLDRQMQRIKDESEPETAELPEVDIEGMQSGEIRTARNGDAWIKVKKI